MPIHLTSRRVFLKGMLGAGAGWALQGCGQSYRVNSTRSARVEPARWAFVADTHISEKPDGDGPRQQMSGQFRAVLADILSCPGRMEGMLINGDVARTRGLPGDYAALIDLLEPARRAEFDLHLILGNHDDRSNLLRAFFGEAPPAVRVPDRHISVVNSGGVRMIMLDSLIRPNHTPGELGPDQLGWLKDTIDADPVQPCVLFLHHYLRGSNQALLDEQAFRDIVLPRRQVKAVFQGHSHEHHFRVDDGLHFVELPATGYAFKEEQPIGWMRAQLGASGCELELRALFGNRANHGQRTSLTWRSLDRSAAAA